MGQDKPLLKRKSNTIGQDKPLLEQELGATLWAKISPRSNEEQHNRPR